MTEYRYDSAALCEHGDYLLPSLLPLLQSPRPLKVADLGCGNGSITNAIAQLGHDVTGVDSSKTAIEQAVRAYPACRFHCAGISSLPSDIERGTFDVVVSAETIEHLFEPRQLLRVARTLLKPDGRLILTTPYHGYLKNVALALSGKMDRHFTALWDGGHVKFFSVRTLTTLLAQEGFQGMHFTFAGRAPFLWKSMICTSRPARDHSR